MYGVKLKFSQNNDFFPGTNDRVLSLTGTHVVICNTLTDIVTRIYEVKSLSLFVIIKLYIFHFTHFIHTSIHNHNTIIITSYIHHNRCTNHRSPKKLQTFTRSLTS